MQTNYRILLIAIIFLGASCLGCELGKTTPDGLATVWKPSTTPLRVLPVSPWYRRLVKPEALFLTQASMDNNRQTLTIFADKPFYRERPEPEITLTGVLQSSPVRVGPNTRDMPFKLETQTETLSVYVSSREEEILDRFVNRKVRVIGKRVDQRAEGYDFEIWIGSISTNDD
ncbi:MAG: hypothetical protein F6J94_26435 [Moorea sp. SIO1F2]|uniref:hypothetical protein n=1 Tax=unclassified Moorena TaxID=2683338 RepID=UPI0013BA11A5|nr:MULTISPECIES: hypothetical protein [unclassified Moorena]NEN96018.1 hypothetical protein [Moorena sp. SIO3I7]NEO43610.1 hypothetical protein [Moorena sp. SIO4A3]NEO64801.1 hypothetical protein [Moorena sp. SIO4G2]NEO07041.1 hypothetical protein [Moorena sp. SIO3I8]NEO14277.1 hypothetical protein [Moorena sp. SIO3E8]